MRFWHNCESGTVDEMNGELLFPNDIFVVVRFHHVLLPLQVKISKRIHISTVYMIPANGKSRKDG
jgi:hypothetical protein